MLKIVKNCQNYVAEGRRKQGEIVKYCVSFLVNSRENLSCFKTGMCMAKFTITVSMKGTNDTEVHRKQSERVKYCVYYRKFARSAWTFVTSLMQWSKTHMHGPKTLHWRYTSIMKCINEQFRRKRAENKMNMSIIVYSLVVKARKIVMLMLKMIKYGQKHKWMAAFCQIKDAFWPISEETFDTPMLSLHQSIKHIV